MCGRFVVARAKAELLADFQIDVVGPDTPDPSFNHAPMSIIPIITISAKDASHRRLEGAKWGLVPPMGKRPDHRRARVQRAFGKRAREANVSTRTHTPTSDRPRERILRVAKAS